MRLLHRAIRRADAPVAWTRGFNPRPRVAFPLALSVGVVGAREVAEFIFDEPVDAGRLRTDLAAQLPEGVRILEVAQVLGKDRARVVGVTYRVEPSPDQSISADRIAHLLAQERIEVTRGRRQERRVDIRPFVRDISVHEDEAGPTLTVELHVSDQGTARPQEILALLGLNAEPGRDAALVTRTCVHLASSSPQDEEDN